MSKKQKRTPKYEQDSGEAAQAPRRKRHKNEPETWPLLTRGSGAAVEITREIYNREKHPQRGKLNPQNMTCPFWEYMVKSEESAWQARQHYGDTPDYATLVAAGPIWTFRRFGMSRTPLPDGRIIYVAGEHEDFYDPDFYIYNDVIVVSPDGSVEIYGYPVTEFPPTDFHSATLVENSIYLIGSVGYAGERRTGVTPVYRLDCNSLAIEAVRTRGANPGWISNHEALYRPKSNSIRIEKGRVAGEDRTLQDNSAQYLLNLNTLVWSEIGNQINEQANQG